MISKFYKKNGEKGFTLLELMIVIAIIGVLAAIAVPQFIQYKKRGFNTSAKTDVRNAYTAAQAFFSNSPAATVTTADLTNFGFIGTSNVTVAITNGTIASLAMTSANSQGDVTYTIDSEGTIAP